MLHIIHNDLWDSIYVEVSTWTNLQAKNVPYAANAYPVFVDILCLSAFCEHLVLS